MKKLLLTLCAFASMLLAHENQSGSAAFANNCVACHIMATRDGIKGQTIIAPPAFRVHEKMVEKYPKEEDFNAFVADFIAAPTQEKANCKGAVKKFGLMPAIGASMSVEERKAVALYLYRMSLEDIAQAKNK